MKPETEIRNLKRGLKQCREQLRTLGLELSKALSRATKAEQEVTVWKARFDILLRREEPKQ